MFTSPLIYWKEKISIPEERLGHAVLYSNIMLQRFSHLNIVFGITHGNFTVEEERGGEVAWRRKGGNIPY